MAQYEILEQVRVRRRKWIPAYFAHPLAGKVGVVVNIETGKHSKKPLYSVIFETKSTPKAECFFADQLEPLKKPEEEN